MNRTCAALFSLALALPVCAEEGKGPDLKDYELVFADEFDGDSLNWELWRADSPKNIKRATSRGPEAVEVSDGRLRLNVRKVDRGKVQWLAGYVYLKKPLENNVYVECRFKSGAASGVNNAFWLSCKTPPNNTWQNRYEIDVVEARLDARSRKGKAHVAWHDWKTYSYMFDKESNKCDIAQGISVEHDFDEYNVWGIWFGENEFVYYLNGREVWRGDTSKRYPHQYHTGVGKAAAWDARENARAYGNHGQEDWDYLGGYNGDKMHVVLSNLPWHDAWTPLIEEKADGTHMSVDYVRVYKPKALLDARPHADAARPGAKTALPRPYSLAEDGKHYFSAEILKKPGEELEILFADSGGKTVGKVAVDKDGRLRAGFGKIASSRTAESPFKDARLVEDNVPTLLVCRFTAKSGHEKFSRDAISAWCAPLEEAKSSPEPYFYPNIDESGNTSQTQGWHVGSKEYSDKSFSQVFISSSLGDLSSFRRLRAGGNFISVTR